jgi:anti-anti-sigma factor
MESGRITYFGGSAKKVSTGSRGQPMVSQEGGVPSFVKITVSQAPGAVTIALSGDDNTSQNIDDLKSALEKAFDAPAGTVVTLDIANLYYIGSEGVGVIAAAHKTAKEKGSELVILNPTQQVSRVFMVTRLESFLNIKRSA